MADRKTGNWLSSVVGNISGFWSRSSSELVTRSDKSVDSRNSNQNTSYEEQGDSDVGEENDGIVIETMSAGPSVTPESKFASKQRAVRYLSPSTLSSVNVASVNSRNRKRAATSILSYNQVSDVEQTITSSIVGSLHSGPLSKRSKMQRDLTDRQSFLSSSFSDVPAPKSYISQSFVSSFTPVSSSTTKPNASRTHSVATSSLSSKTRAILEQLQKISSPVKEVNRLPINFNEPERWANDFVSNAIQKPPRNSMCSLSRAQMISNILNTKSPSVFWSRATNTNKIMDPFSDLSHNIQTTDYSAVRTAKKSDCEKVLSPNSSSLSLKYTSPMNLSQKPESSESLIDDQKKPTISSKSTASAVEAQDISVSRSSSNKTNNVFSAKALELDISSPVKEVKRNDKEEMVLATEIDEDLFPFAPPLRRGPFISAQCEEIPQKQGVILNPLQVPRSSSFPTVSDTVSVSEDTPVTVQRTRMSLTADGKNTEGLHGTVDIKENPAIQKSVTLMPAAVDKATSSALDSKPSLQQCGEQWSCPKCMVFVKGDIEKCVCCGYEKKHGITKHWTCDECWVPNKLDVDKCVSCGCVKKGRKSITKQVESISENSTSTNVFGDHAFKPHLTTQGILFGFPTTKPVMDTASISTCLPSLSTAQSTLPAVNGNANVGSTLKFGLTSSASMPSFGLGKIPETSISLPAITETQPAVLPSSQPQFPTLRFGIPSSSTTTSAIPLISSSFSFPSLVSTSSTSIATGRSENIFKISIPTTMNPFNFGSFNTTSAAMDKVPTGEVSMISTTDMGKIPTAVITEASPAEICKTSVPSLFTFGSSASSLALTNSASTGTSAVPLPASESTVPTFSTPKLPLFGAVDRSTVNSENHDVVEMSSPVTSPVTSNEVGIFGLSKSSTAPIFSFGASNASISTSVGGLFGSLQTTMPGVLGIPGTPLFSFGQQQSSLDSKPFQSPASLTSPPSTFNFGSSASNGGTGFVFGSTAPPLNFAFGGQQLSNNSTSSFNFTPAASFGLDSFPLSTLDRHQRVQERC
ncbi:unnamed protein product [Thelazia callipaeda]|uniref:RanBP2-type domain-containing protein n=1 Tax=Thelazia callipaeda TaxID=103827 RepID=A0A0N5CWF6_THECL|nr:unnamed protein product [Thelazia callipaeda]